MGAARASKNGSIVVLVAAAALVLPPAQGIGRATPPGPGDPCTVTGTSGPDVLTGTPGDDVICGFRGDDQIDGLGGDDLIRGGDDDDTIDGGPGNDYLNGGYGDDAVSGGDGNDQLNGYAGIDTVSGDAGNDDVHGGADSDTLAGGADDDVIGSRDGGTVDDVLCGAGADHAYVDYVDTPDGSCEVVRVLDVLPPTAVDDDFTVAEDDPATLLAVRANDTDPDGGPKNIASATQPAHGTVVVGPGKKKLSYQPEAGYCNDGTTTDDFTYTLTPGSTSATVHMTVTCVDDPGTAADDTATLDEDDPATTIDVLANDSDADAGSVVDTVTQPANGTVAITNSGADLTYKPNANYCNTPPGSTTDDFTYDLNGGSSATVEATVNCVDDPATAADDAATVSEDDPATAVDVFANDADGDGPPLKIGSVTQPTNGTVAITGGGTGLTYKPHANYCNNPPGTTTDDFTYTTTPDGVTATVEMTVTCVNDAPVADDESFSGAASAVGNTVLVVNDPTDGAPGEAGPHKTVAGDVLDGDTDIDSAGPLSVLATTTTTSDGGSAVIEADGDFVYTPKAGTSCTDHSDSFTYTVGDGDGGTDTGTVTIATSGCVWYVSNNAAGNSGTSNAPLDTLAQAETLSAVNDTIYVFDGNNTGYGAGITLKANQRLLGEAADLDVGADHLADDVPANRPTLTASGVDVVSLGSGNTVQGLDIDPGGAGGGIAGGSGDNGGTIADVRIVDAGAAGTQPGLELDATTGSFAISDLTVSTSGATGVRLNNAGTVAFAAVGTISVTTTGAKALDLASTNLGTSTFDTVTVTGSGSGGVSATSTTGTLAFGDLALTTTAGPAAAFFLSSVASVTVPASGTATINASGGPAVDVASAAGAVLAFDSVTSTGSANDGVNLDGLGTGTFSAPSGTISGATGLAFDLNGGSGDVTYGGAITNGAGSTAEVTGRTAGTVTFAGSVSDNADDGGGISLSSNTGGSTVFSAPTVLNTTFANAVSMTTSDGHTLRFTGGGLTLTTTSGRAFNADASGTVAVTGASNIINTTGGGRALSIANTDIGADDVTFQSISASGGSNGIVLDNTGSAGNLLVTGNGGTCTIASTTGCSGGTIAGFTGGDDAGTAPVGTGIVLRNTAAPSFTRIHINANGGSENYGIRGTNVAGFTLVDSVVDGTLGTNAATANKDGALRFEELTGTVTMTNVPISGGYFTNLMVDNTAGNLNATLTNVDSLALADGDGTAGTTTSGGDDAVQFEGIGTSDMNVVYQNSQITTANGDLFQYIGDGTGGGDLDFTGNALSNNDPTIFTGGGGVAITAGAKGAATLDILNNTFQGSKTNALTVIKTADASGGTNNLVANIANNVIGVAGTANSGSADGDGMEISTWGDGNATFNVTSNQIRQYNSSGLQFIAGSGSVGTGQLNLNITGNTVANPGTNPSITLLQGIRVDSGVNVSDTYSTCVDFGANSITGSSDAANKDFRLVASQNTTVRQPGYGGGATDGAAFALYAASRIGGGAQGTAAANSPATFSGGGAC